MRIQPITPPFPPFAREYLERLTPPGVAPLALFTVLARDERLFGRFMGGGLLDRGHLTLRQRELVIDRITAACGSEYEWGVHVTLFASKVGFTERQLASLVHGGPDDDCWSSEERVLLRICDELQASCSIDDSLWTEARASLSEMALLEILMLAGFYRTVSYLTNGLRLEPESWGRLFPAASSGR